MKKSPWALRALILSSPNTVINSVFVEMTLSYNKAKYLSETFESTDAKALLKEVINRGLTFRKNELSSDMKELLAQSKYLLAKLTVETSTGYEDYEAFLLLKDALRLKPNFEEALDLMKSVEMENNFFKHRESNVGKKQ